MTIKKRILVNRDLFDREFKTNKPFPFISIKDFFEENFASEILESLKNLEYYEEDHDLYSFQRTVDFKNVKSKEIKVLREYLLSDEFIDFVSFVSNIKINRKKIDLHSLKLSNGDYLLCHDDMVEERKIAFVINLTKDFNVEDGGELQLFNVDSKNKPISISKSIRPKFNTFNMFLVSKTSFHEISEVLSNKDRISISGWFYEVQK